MKHDIFTAASGTVAAAVATEQTCTTGGCQWYEAEYWSGDDC